MHIPKAKFGCWATPSLCNLKPKETVIGSIKFQPSGTAIGTINIPFTRVLTRPKFWWEHCLSQDICYISPMQGLICCAGVTPGDGDCSLMHRMQSIGWPYPYNKSKFFKCSVSTYSCLLKIVAMIQAIISPHVIDVHAIFLTCGSGFN